MTNVEIIAHRGVHDRAPENSIDAMVAAIDAGADAIELDVHATSDGVVVVHHDFAVPYEPGATGRGLMDIAALTFDYLTRYRLHDGSTIPQLSEVLRLVGGRAHVYVEIKGKGIEKQVVDCIRSVGTPASIHSFDHRIVKRCGELDAGIPRGILLDSYLVNTTQVMRDANATAVWQRWDQIDTSLVRDVHEADGRVIAWTVNRPSAAAHLARLGVDAICTDAVTDTRAALAAAQ